MAPRSSRRSLRYRPGSGSLSVQVLTRASLPSGRGVARSFSGDTLVAGVPGMANPAGQKDATEKDMIEKDTAEKGTTGKDTSRKYNTEKDTTALGTTGSATPTNIPSPPVQPATQLRNAVRRVKTAVHSASTVLGKRKWTRDVPAASRRHSSRLSDAAEKLNHQSAQQSAQQQLPPNKRPKTETASPQTGHGSDETECRKQAPPRRKRWLRSGLYIGQERDFDAKLTESKNRLKRTAIAAGKVRKVKRVLPLPMFTGERLLARGRDFRLPFDVYSPLPSRQPKPEEWRKVSRNVCVGDALTEWKRAKKLESSKCLCAAESGCDENCQNRFMYYECNNGSCNLGPEHCTNRAFAQLKERYKSGNKYDVGVEVFRTDDRGFGVRSNRTFEPHQIIVEYAGEIISQEECEKRMRKDYKNNECYYLMTFHQGMIIDATRGSIARFVNHSCEPNCKMIKWTIEGEPRMALFASENGIMTGEELTYDYNFDPFSQKNVQKCRCGAPSCRGFLGPKSKTGEVVAEGVMRKVREAIGASTSSSSTSTSEITASAPAERVGSGPSKRQKVGITVPGRATPAVRTKLLKPASRRASTSVINERSRPLVSGRAKGSERQASRTLLTRGLASPLHGTDSRRASPRSRQKRKVAMPWLKTQIKASGGEEKERGARKVAAQIKKGLLKAVRRPGRPSMRLRLEITES